MNDSTEGQKPPAPAGAGGEEERPTYFIRAVDRGMAILRCLGDYGPELTLAEVAGHAGVSRAVARRFLLTFADLGYVRVGGGRYSLLPRILELGVAYLSHLEIRELAISHMEALTETIGETTSLGILDGGDVVHVARISAHNIVRPSITVGSRFPAYLSSMGRVLLAGMDHAAFEQYLESVELVPRTRHTVRTKEALRKVIDQTRAQGWSLVDEELGDGLLSVAAPVVSRDGQVVAALTVSTSTARWTGEHLRERVLPDLQRTVAVISRAMTVAASGAALSVHL